MSGTLREQNEMRIAEEAAEWLGLLERADRQQHEAFAKWVTESRRHVEEFLFASAVERVLDRVDPQHRLDVDAILQRAAANIVPLERTAVPRTESGTHARRNRRRILPWAAAAGIAAVATAAGLWIQSAGLESYRTAVGEQRKIDLPDGSSLYLNTQSRARVHYTAAGRDIELVSGEALFDVKRDAARPFRVRSGEAVIQALGTQFNVYRRTQATTVAVIDGAVRISTQHESSKLVATPEKSVGEQARIVADGRITPRQPVEVTRVAAWRQRRLMFHADTLEDIAAEFNRYNDVPQIRIEGEAVRARRFTGIFNANDPRALVQFLGSYGDLKVEEEKGVLSIRAR